PAAGPPLDFQSHLAALEAQGLLVRVDRPINKDTELHPLVRWQFQGGLKEDQRRAFLFANVTDSSGRRYDIPVAVGALAASPRIYAAGMGGAVEEIEAAWVRALPAVYHSRVDAALGGLISYGPDTVDQYRRAAGYVDRVLKGEKPSDLQAPTKYELVINLKT